MKASSFAFNAFAFSVSFSTSEFLNPISLIVGQY
jgi:hypothetical protein